jgi:hypothetical protein
MERLQSYPGSLPASGLNTGIHQPVSILDTGATVMRTLGLQTHTEWESRPVEEIFQFAFIAAAPNSNVP